VKLLAYRSIDAPFQVLVLVNFGRPMFLQISSLQYTLKFVRDVQMWGYSQHYSKDHTALGIAQPIHSNIDMAYFFFELIWKSNHLGPNLSLSFVKSKESLFCMHKLQI